MHRSIYILLLLVAFCTRLYAQDNQAYSTDSTPVSSDQTTQQSLEDYQETKPDTSLFFKQLWVHPDTVQSWKNAKAFGYARYLDSLLKEQQNQEPVKKEDNTPDGPSWLDSVFASPITSIFFWVLAGFFILFILYRLFLAEGFFIKRSASKGAAVAEVTDENINAGHDFDNSINQAVRSGNYRLAVRYQYLKTIHKLAAKQVIELAADKTNFQYVREIANHDYQNEFASLTLSYEYVWYGEFNIDETIYNKIAPGFTGFNQKIQPVF